MRKSRSVFALANRRLLVTTAYRPIRASAMSGLRATGIRRMAGTSGVMAIGPDRHMQERIGQPRITPADDITQDAGKAVASVARTTTETEIDTTTPTITIA